MIKTVKKRNGQVVPFDRNKITRAIELCYTSFHGKPETPVDVLTDRVVVACNRHDDQTVEGVQDLVEQILFEAGEREAYKRYTLYRQQRTDTRNSYQMLLDGAELVEGYLGNLDWRVKENSNMTYSLQGLNFYMASAVVARYWLERIYPQEVKEAHKEGDIHIHDLGVLAAYCCGWDLYDLLARGFTGVPGKVSSAPAKHFSAALGQIVNFLYTLQGETAGAQAFSNFDTLLAPFVRYDRLDYQQVKQQIQEFVFNCNVPTRVGFQCPFSNITFDFVPSHIYENQPVIIGGQLQGVTYGEFQDEMDMINKAFAEVMLEGDSQGRVFTFPIPTYNITKDFDWGNEKLEPVWQMTAKYGLPYFSNFINSDMKPEDARSMCCRLRLDNRELQKRGGGLFGSNPLTGSVGVVTINMPRLATKENFFDALERQMNIASTSLEIKRKQIERLTEQGLYPYSKVYLQGVKDARGSCWANHFSTIGLNGMNECCLNYLGVGIETEQGKEFALRVLDFMRERVAEFQVRFGNLYNLEATPAEGASYRLAKIDRERGIRTAGNGTPYYTNSTQLPVDFTTDVFEALDHQDELQTKYTGGTVFHGFLGEQLDDWRQARLLVRKIAENYHLPYFTLTPTFSVCSEHGYLSGEQKVCPYCDRTCEVYSRIVGYIRPTMNWNVGKQEEYKERTEFAI